jgi:hypothetical protein
MIYGVWVVNFKSGTWDADGEAKTWLVNSTVNAKLFLPIC